MKNAILICSKEFQLTEKYDQIFSFGTLVELELKHKGISSDNIFDIQIPDYNFSLRKKLEDLIYNESKNKPQFWINLAYQHILYRYINYYQYKLRFGIAIEENEINHFYLSSNSDDILKHAFISACNEKSINYDIFDGSIEKQSSLTPLSATFDLPNKNIFLEKLISYFLAFYYRISSNSTFYESYNYSSIPGAFKFSFNRSITPLGLYTAKFNSYNIRNSFININQKIKESSNVELNKNLWKEFNETDIKVIKSSIKDFFERYEPSYLKNLSKTMILFFKISKVKRIILSSDNTSSSRFLFYSAKKAGLKVDFSPHGLMYDFQYLNTGREFNPDRILVWDKETQEKLATLKIKSEIFSKFKSLDFDKSKKKKELPIVLDNTKVLILANEWNGLSSKIRPDCFENDLMETLKGLKKLGISSISIKFHNSTSFGVKIKRKSLEKLINLTKLKIDIIDPIINPKSIFKKFDLVVLGSTTGILDLLDSTTPFVIFRGFIEDISIFKGINLPQANNHLELINAITKIDVNKIDFHCQCLIKNLTNNNTL